MFRSRIIEKTDMKAPLYTIEVKYVGPQGTTNSRKHAETMRRYG